MQAGGKMIIGEYISMGISPCLEASQCELCNRTCLA